MVHMLHKLTFKASILSKSFSDYHSFSLISFSFFFFSFFVFILVFILEILTIFYQMKTQTQSLIHGHPTFIQGFQSDL